MLTLALVPLTCWLCTLLAIPRRPLPGNEVQELVYRRLLGRQQRLALLALVASAVAFSAFIIRMPGIASAEIATAQEPSQVVCDNSATGQGVCWVAGRNGMWAVMRQPADGPIVVEDYAPGAPPTSSATKP